MSNRLESSNAPRHRRDAATCGLLAASAKSVADRELLQGMQRSLLRRADHEDRFDGSAPCPAGAPAGVCSARAILTSVAHLTFLSVSAASPS